MRRRGFLAGIALGGLTALLSGCGTEPSAEAAPKTSKGKTQKMTLPHTPLTPPPGKQIATLAGGCFWCTEAIFDELKGVEKVEPGYAGGQTANPSYEAVCGGRTGHAEAIQITFDPKVISYHDLLAIFFSTHDPTTLNRQGADTGTQYRSAIFTNDAEQKATAEQVVREVEKERIWPNPIITEITPFTNFYPAEEYHRDYYARNGQQSYCRFVIEPKVAKFRAHYADKLKR